MCTLTLPRHVNAFRNIFRWKNRRWFIISSRQYVPSWIFHTLNYTINFEYSYNLLLKCIYTFIMQEITTYIEIKKYWEYYWIVFQWRKYNEAYTASFTICYLHPKASYKNITRAKSLLVLDTEENFKCFRQTLECAQGLSFNYILLFLILLP